MKPELNFETRSESPAFLNECGLTGTGAEIGVQEGIYSEHILKTWKGSTLFSIDAWQNFDAANISTSPTDQMINKSSFMRIPHSGCDPLASTPLYGG